jgi:hypothetical protein
MGMPKYRILSISLCIIYIYMDKFTDEIIMGNVHCCISEVAESGGTLLTLCFHTIRYVYGSFGSIITS